MDISSPDHRYDACELLLMQDGKVHLDMIWSWTHKKRL
jgi:hypothetical protein